MPDDQHNPTAPGQPLSFNAKVTLGVIAITFLYLIFAPTSSPPSAPPSQPKSVSPKPQDRGPDFVPVGTVVHMVETAPACSALDNLTKFRQLATERDKEAVVAMVDRGECEVLAKGIAVTVEDTSVWRSAECVRKAGDTDCLWTMLKSTDGRFR